MAKSKPAILTKETLLLYWEQIRADKVGFWIMTICIPIAALLLDTAIPYVLSLAIGTFADGDTVQMQKLLWLAGGLAIVGVTFNLAGFQFAVRHESAVRTRLVTTTLSRLLEREQEFFADQKVGGLTGKFIDFINGHIGIQDLFVLRTLSFCINIAVGLTLIAIHSPPLAAIIVVLLLGLFLQIRIFRKMRDGIRAERKRLTAEVNGTVADTITNNVTVKTFAGEAHEAKLAKDIARQYEQAHRRDFALMSFEGSGRILFMQIFQLGTMSVAAMLLLNGQIPLAIAIFIVTYLQRLASQLFTLGELINGYDKILLQSTPMTEILLEPPLVVDKTDAALHVVKGRISFQDVCYAYNDAKDVAVLKNLSLTIPAGQKVGLVGVSGAGKTTITKLLLRFDDIDSGQITIDGQDISDVTQSSLRRNIAYVSQEPLLFHRSLADNIAYGSPGASLAVIKHAAGEANAMEFINRLPQGFDTIVGERGIKLSGGQRQRVAIARAILKDAPILVLDEATSALDSVSEKLIQASLENLMKGRTSIVIAHRLSTISKLDRIIVLEDGKIVEDGTHDDLVKENGTYAKLWTHQSGGFIKE